MVVKAGRGIKGHVLGDGCHLTVQVIVIRILIIAFGVSLLSGKAEIRPKRHIIAPVGNVNADKPVEKRRILQFLRHIGGVPDGIQIGIPAVLLRPGKWDNPLGALFPPDPFFKDRGSTAVGAEAGGRQVCAGDLGAACGAGKDSHIILIPAFHLHSGASPFRFIGIHHRLTVLTEQLLRSNIKAEISSAVRAVVHRIPPFRKNSSSLHSNHNISQRKKRINRKNVNDCDILAGYK